MKNAFLLINAAMMFSICTASLAGEGADGADPLKQNGLIRTTSAYVLKDEVNFLKGMGELHKTKKAFDADAVVRQGYQKKIDAARAFIAKCRKEHEQLNDRLSIVTSISAHNRIVVRMNGLLIKMKESAEEQKEAEDAIGQLGGDLPTQYADDVMELNSEAESVTQRYEELAADPDVMAAIDKANRHASTPVKLGPSADFVAAAAEIAKLRDMINAEAIPLTEEHGNQLARVLINGESFKMVVDSGASFITLTGEDAERLQLRPGSTDETIQLQLADGHIIQARHVVLKSVRVGRFTAQDVDCAVMAKGLEHAHALLGNSFLSHFIVKLDQKAGKLHLTEINAAEKKTLTEKAIPKSADEQ